MLCVLCTVLYISSCRFDKAFKKKKVSLEDQEEDGDHGQQEDHPSADGCRGFFFFVATTAHLT